MNMNREVLEEEARKIQEQAKLAQAGLQTMKNLQKCLVHGHTFEMLLGQLEFHEILQIRLVCSTCGAQTELFENISLEMPDDEEKVGALATLGLNEIDVEVDEYPPHDGDGATIDFDPVEEQTQEENGVRTVDVSNLIKSMKEQRGIEDENSGDKK